MSKEQVISTISQAIRLNKSIQIVYFKSDGEISKRTLGDIMYASEDIDKQNSTEYNLDDNYITAYCHLRKERRTFKIERIIEVKIL